MSLYRCAVCGSPNVVTDTQTAGVGYDYGKGLVGTLLFGSGGAAAGVRSKQQKVFKCPDCGQTLTYSMDEETKRAIDMGVMDADSRNKLRLLGVPVSWDFLKKKYKNIESGLADQTIARREENELRSIEAGKELLKSYGPATKEEFDEAVDTIISFRGRMGESLYRRAIDEEYSQRNMPKLSEYRAYCNAVDLFIENAFKFFSAEELDSSYYRRYALNMVFEDSIAPYLFRKYVSDCGEMKRSAISSFPNRMPGNSFNLIDYVVSEPFVWEIMAQWSDTRYSGISGFRKDSYRNSELINHILFKDYFHRYKAFGRVIFNTVIPVLMEEDGVLYWWDGPSTCFNKMSQSEETYYRNNKIYPSWIAQMPEELRAIDTYFKQHPEKKAEFERDIKEIENKSTGMLIPNGSQIALLAKKYDYLTVWHPIEE